ncbi:hypothetical protein Taro_035695 [Colocasia esculenta]|uniref:Vacuolar iron transporter n=1 Tax=Colocasia esculenta TaxID=4460 RepID=A0A843VV76_COLES|nr:hypothetical protein [Colocasia esculenta]
MSFRINPNSQVPALSDPSSKEASNHKEESGLQLSTETRVLDLEKGGDTSAVDYLARANWLRAAVLGANDGLVSVASLMIGVGAVNQTAKAMLVSGLAGLVAGACSMAIGEFVSVYAQYDIEVAQMEKKNTEGGREVSEEEKETLPSPLQAAGASALAFALGGVLPLLAGGFIRSWGVRVGVVCGMTSVGLAGFGAAGGFLGGAPMSKSAIRVLVGGWLAMLLTYGVLRLFGLAFKMQMSSA